MNKKLWKLNEIKDVINNVQTKSDCVVMAKKYDVSERAISSLVRRYTNTVPWVRNPTKRDQKQIHTMRESGITWGDIAQSIGVSRSSVQRWSSRNLGE